MSEVIAITGGSGFLAAHLARTAAQRGQQVWCLSRSLGMPERLGQIAPGAQVLHWDPAQPHQALAQIPGLSAIIHAAACYGRAGEPLSALVEANTLLGLRLAEAAIAQRVPKFIAIGTSLPSSVSAYAASKADGAAWLRRCGDRLSIVEARLEHFYGAGDDVSKFTSKVVRACVRRASHLELTSGVQRRDFIHVSDAASAICAILEHQAATPGYAVIEVGSGCAVPVREFVEQVKALSGAATELRFGSVPQRAAEPEQTRADISALRAMGWSPRHDLRSGIQQTIDEERTLCAS